MAKSRATIYGWLRVYRKSETGARIGLRRLAPHACSCAGGAARAVIMVVAGMQVGPCKILLFQPQPRSGLNACGSVFGTVFYRLWIGRRWDIDGGPRLHWWFDTTSL